MNFNRNRKQTQRQEQFLAIADTYKEVIAKVCSVYTSDTAPFADLYQEVMINIWSGLESYRGDAKLSTWIYRLAINTCITWHRRTKRQKLEVSLDGAFDIPARDDETASRIAFLYKLIGMLNDFDKALITLWLDEKPYEEIAVILGISKANVATRLHRVRARLSDLAKENE